MSHLTLWGRRSSFNVQKVLWVLDILQLAHDHIELGGKFGGLDTKEFQALNPHQKVPVLRDGDLVIWESHAIIRYLAAQYGTVTLWRDTPRERSFIDRWVDWAATRLQPDFMALFWGYYRTPEQKRNAVAIKAAREACTQNFELLNKHLSTHTFLHDNGLTLADIPAGATLYRYFTMGVDVPQPPHLLAWYRRLCAMESYQKQIMLPFDELFGRSVY